MNSGGLALGVHTGPPAGSPRLLRRAHHLIEGPWASSDGPEIVAVLRELVEEIERLRVTEAAR